LARTMRQDAGETTNQESQSGAGARVSGTVSGRPARNRVASEASERREWPFTAWAGQRECCCVAAKRGGSAGGEVRRQRAPAKMRIRVEIWCDGWQVATRRMWRCARR